MTTASRYRKQNRRATLRRRDEAAAREIAFGHWSGRRSFVYFVERDGLVKIGTTVRLSKRVHELRGRLLATELGGHNRESQVHERFAHLHVTGEWFRLDPDLLAYVAALGSTS